MSNVDTPPNPYYSGINFNPSFFTVVSSYLTEAIANSKYLRLIGGILTGNLGIKRTPQVELDVNGKAMIHSNTGSFPENSILGSIGTRLKLWPGSPTDTPHAFGINASTLWYGVPAAANHIFFTGTTERMQITNTQMILNTNINLKMTQAILDLSDATGNSPIYLAPAGAALLGTANANGHFSTSAVVGDTILRGQASRKLYLQSGAGAAAMTILDNGRIGIGITDPSELLHVNGGNLLVNGTKGIMHGGPNLTLATVDSNNHANNCYYNAFGGDMNFYTFWGYSINLNSAGLNPSGNTANSRIPNTSSFTINEKPNGGTATTAYNNLFTVRQSGNTGIGTDNPARNLQVHKNAANQDVSISFTDIISGAGASAGFAIGKNVDQSCYLWNHQNTYMQFSTNNSERMRIRNDGNIGIATNNPGNILQVGDGARLRISNGPSDYTTIGTKQGDDAANTCIYLNGNTLSGNAGNIAYYATTSTGRHAFFTNGDPSNTLATLSPDKCRFFKPLRSMNCQYENEGQQYPFTSGMVNSGGTTLNGYFIPVNEYTNSLMVCAFSHDSTSYTYWRGHVSIGNNNQILAVSSPIASSNLLVEAFIQQTTLIQFIRVVPTVSYSVQTLLRVKIYG